MLLVVTARPQFLDRPACWTVGAADVTLGLEPLLASDASLAAYLCGPGGLDAGTSDHVVARAEGNPLVLEELLRFLATVPDLARWMPGGPRSRRSRPSSTP